METNNEKNVITSEEFKGFKCYDRWIYVARDVNGKIVKMNFIHSYDEFPEYVNDIMINDKKLFEIWKTLHPLMVQTVSEYDIINEAADLKLRLQSIEDEQE